jgi:ribose transport system permease protein/putative xylitol transport system permease protein
MYIRGGENVYPPEVEEVLTLHPGVMFAAVIGVHDKLMGEEGKAFIVPMPGGEAPAEDEIKQWCAERLAKFKVPSFLATLGISIIVEGMALYLSKGFLRVMQNDPFRSLAITFVAGLPSIFYWGIGIWGLSTFIALCTVFGRRTYAVGGNLEGAGLSDINVARHRIYIFMLSGFLSGLAGVLYMSQMGGGSVNIGSDMAIPLFASVVAGGTALTGGVGGPHRTLLGVIIITWIQAGMSMLAIGNDVQMITFGLIAVGMSVATIDRKRIKVIK